MLKFIQCAGVLPAALHALCYAYRGTKLIIAEVRHLMTGTETSQTMFELQAKL